MSKEQLVALIAATLLAQDRIRLTLWNTARASTAGSEDWTDFEMLTPEGAIEEARSLISLAVHHGTT